MAYTATKYLSPAGFSFPKGQDDTQRMVVFRGSLVENDTAGNYSTGGVGSTAFQVTAFSAVGLVTYNSLVGAPLINGQRVVIFNTASNTNDGTFIVSQIIPSSAVAGTFVALPIPGKTLAGSAQTSQTAEGVGQIQWGTRVQINQTFTATAVSVTGGIATITYTTLVGPQLQPGQSVTFSGMTNAGNNGTFSVTGAFPTSSTGGTFTITNPSGVSTDSGTGTGIFMAGLGNASANETPVQIKVDSNKGWIYKWDPINQTIRIFGGATSGAILAEAALGAVSSLFDGGITFEGVFTRSSFNTNS